MTLITYKNEPFNIKSHVMKIGFIIFLPLCHMIGVIHAQEIRINPKISIAEITTIKNESMKGILYAVNDSSVALYTENTAVDKNVLQRDSLPLRIYSYREIQKIKVRKRSALAEGALIGAGVGLVLGVPTDLAAQSITLSTEEVSFSTFFTITFGLIGTAVGAIIGSSSKKFKINGDENFLGQVKMD